MHFFSRKALALCIFTLLVLFALVLLDSGTMPAHAATHGTSVVSQATTINNHKVAMQGASTVHGCPSGYACIYPNAGWNGDHPSLKWFHYGTYQLSNQYGAHYIYNNQTGGAPLWFCTNWAGTTCPLYAPAGTWAVADLTPINSVKLVRSL